MDMKRSNPFYAISPFPFLLTTGDGLDRQGAQTPLLHSILEKSGYDNRCSTHFPTKRNLADQKISIL